MSLISVSEIEQRLRAECERLVATLLPNAKRDGGHLRVGSVFGEDGQSLGVALHGPKRGLWQDYSGTDHGDMIDLIAATQGCDKGGAVAWAKDWLGIVDSWSPKDARAPDPAERAARAEEARARAEARCAQDALDKASRIRGARALYLHRDAVPIAGTPAEAYLLGRGLKHEPLPQWPNSLKFHPEVYHGGERCKIPAMLAPVYLADGTHVATHRTFLQACSRRGWTKIDAKNAKMVLGPMSGGFVPINKGASGKAMRHAGANSSGESEPVYLTEGIEDALVVRMRKPEARIVAAIALGNIGAIVLPAAVKRLVVCCDRDDNQQAIGALEQALARQQARGLEVFTVMPPAQVNGRATKDLNDWLLGLARPSGRRGATG